MSVSCLCCAGLGVVGVCGGGRVDVGATWVQGERVVDERGLRTEFIVYCLKLTKSAHYYTYE